MIEVVGIQPTMMGIMTRIPAKQQRHSIQADPLEAVGAREFLHGNHQPDPKHTYGLGLKGFQHVRRAASTARVPKSEEAVPCSPEADCTR